MKAGRIGVVVIAVSALVGCTSPQRPSPTVSSTMGGPTTSSLVGTAQPPPSTEPSAAGLEYRVTYPFGVPSSPVSITHPVHPPIAGPSAPPLPYLVGIYAADHPEGSPQYQRISFYFRGAFPSYQVGYVPAVRNEGQGTPIALPGNAFLLVGFSDAQAHDNAGASTVAVSPKNPIGLRNLRGYGFAGDFEGHLSYGLGLQVAQGSDQALKIRIGELKKPDGSGGYFYVVHVDVQTA
jgi:hypothetical protein